MTEREILILELDQLVERLNHPNLRDFSVRCRAPPFSSDEPTTQQLRVAVSDARILADRLRRAEAIAAMASRSAADWDAADLPTDPYDGYGPGSPCDFGDHD